MRNDIAVLARAVARSTIENLCLSADDRARLRLGSLVQRSGPAWQRSCNRPGRRPVDPLADWRAPTLVNESRKPSANAFSRQNQAFATSRAAAWAANLSDHGPPALGELGRAWVCYVRGQRRIVTGRTTRRTRSWHGRKNNAPPPTTGRVSANRMFLCRCKRIQGILRENYRKVAKYQPNASTRKSGQRIFPGPKSEPVMQLCARA